ncbi:hypothetical protein [Salipaludibacillus sp. CF4.18]|uniref:hypothetical protein n=1 Tax=Salipaludibacillus sp. CF4.18 TaxID=3373081 RepID=UPI003EE62B4C
MFKNNNDIHLDYFILDNLLLDERYRYDFINFDISQVEFRNFANKGIYFFVFTTQLKPPFNIYLNVVPYEALDVIKVTSHSDCHFKYLQVNRITKYEVHSNLIITKKNNEIFASLHDQKYRDWKTNESKDIKTVNYLLLVKAPYFNSYILLPRAFSIQLEIFEKMKELDMEEDVDRHQRLLYKTNDLNDELIQELCNYSSLTLS